MLPIIYYPDDRLRKISKSVTKINNAVQYIIDDMFETMYNNKGIGLAAPQVNIHKKIIVIDISENHDQKFVFINPTFLEKIGKTGIYEGCLSFPGQYGFVPRAKKIKICALDRDGKSFELNAEDLLSVCIQHEMDHLIGTLFVDYLSLLKRQIIHRKMKKLERTLKLTKKKYFEYKK